MSLLHVSRRGPVLMCCWPVEGGINALNMKVKAGFLQHVKKKAHRFAHCEEAWQAC